MRTIKDTKSSKIKAYKKKVDLGIFVKDRENIIENYSEISECQRPLRCSTMQGERVSIAISEEIPTGATCEFTIQCLDDNDFMEGRKMTKEFLEEMDEMFQKKIESISEDAIEKHNYQIFIDIRKTFIDNEKNDVFSTLKTTILVIELTEKIGYEFTNIIDLIKAASKVFAVFGQIKEDKEVDFDFDVIMFYPDGNQKILNFKEEYQNFLEFKERQDGLLSDLIN